MLHTNIPAMHRSYLPTDSGLATAPFYPPTTPVERPSVPLFTEETQAHNDTATNTPPESQNFLLAQTIAETRGDLQNRLAQIPLSALCLLTFIKSDDITEPEPSDETTHLNPDADLARIVESYKQALRYTQTFGSASPQAIHSQQLLSSSLQTITLNAELLKKIASLVTYAVYNHLRNKKDAAQANASSPLLRELLKITAQNESSLNAQLKLLNSGSPSLTTIDFHLPDTFLSDNALADLINLQKNWLSARRQLAQANERLVLYLANQYKGGFLDFNDLVQEGQSGLLKAVDRYDHRKGFKFSTYAVYWIRQGISRALTRNERVVRLPFGQMANISKVHRAKDAYLLKTGKEISIPELATQTQLSEAEVDTILIISQSATSLDNPLGDDEDASTLADFLEQQVYDHPLNSIASAELSDTLAQALKTLNDKEAKVLGCRFGLTTYHEMTLEDIGRELNLTRERVRQIQVTALKKIKLQFGNELVHFLS